MNSPRRGFSSLLGLSVFAGLFGSMLPSMPALPPDHALPRVAQKKHGKPGTGHGGAKPLRAMYRHWEGYTPYVPEPRFDSQGFITGGPRALRTGYRCRTHSTKAVA